ncbi:MAG TPA: hypothetical protein VK419_14365 [Bryobacteraceae bacterium]|nr:hypothetical protein [Bryobacteraceae bacterium]
MRVACLFLIAGSAAWAQLSGPMLGWTPDGSRIRPMYGLAGAAALGDPIDLGRDLALIAPSPGGTYVVATDADNGQALLIVNGNVAAINGVTAGAASIAISPRGSSAALWFSSGHFQIVTGLPGAPAVRDVDASFLEGEPVAFAVSDDGQSLAGSWPSGAWLFNASGAVPVPVDERIDAVAFLAQQSTLVVATVERVLSIASGNVTTLYDWSRESAVRRPLSPLAGSAAAGIAASVDGRRVVMANRAGLVLDLNILDGTASLSRCGCAPEGVSGLGGSAFRLTSPANGGVRVFDASMGSIFVVPPMFVPASSEPAANLTPSAATLPALPAVTIGAFPSKTGYDQTIPVTISIASPYAVNITGTVTLTFQSSVGGDDQDIVFTTAAGGRTATFTIPAGATTASFSGNCTASASNLCFDTGTVAGTITLTLDFMASGTDITPSPAPAATYTTSPTVPSIQTVTLEQTPGGVTVLVTGLSSTRDMSSGAFTFAAATGTTISDPTVNVPLSSAFTTWYSNTASNAYGSQFTLTMPFPVSGQAGDLVSVTVTLTNSKGTSTSVSPTQ